MLRPGIVDHLWTGLAEQLAYVALTSGVFHYRRGLRSRVLLSGHARGQHCRRGGMLRAHSPPAIAADIRNENTPLGGVRAWCGPGALAPRGCSSELVVARVPRTHPLKLHDPQ